MPVHEGNTTGRPNGAALSYLDEVSTVHNSGGEWQSEQNELARSQIGAEIDKDQARTQRAVSARRLKLGVLSLGAFLILGTTVALYFFDRVQNVNALNEELCGYPAVSYSSYFRGDSSSRINIGNAPSAEAASCNAAVVWHRVGRSKFVIDRRITPGGTLDMSNHPLGSSSRLGDFAVVFRSNVFDQEAAFAAYAVALHGPIDSEPEVSLPSSVRGPGEAMAYEESIIYDKAPGVIASYNSETGAENWAVAVCADSTEFLSWQWYKRDGGHLVTACNGGMWDREIDPRSGATGPLPDTF